MVTKIYGIYNTAEAFYILKIGKVSVKCSFSKGIIDGTDRYPARLQTSNRIAQLAIENSALFNSKIFLLSTIGEDKPEEKGKKGSGKKEAAPNVNPGAVVTDEGEGESNEDSDTGKQSGPKEYPEVTTVGDAVVILKNMGVKASRLGSTAKVLEVANELGISFPELTL